MAEKAGAFLPRHQHHLQSELVQPAQPEVAIDTGVVVFSGAATAALVRMASSEPFKGCTSRGVEEGATALRLELYSDLLLALRTDATGDEGTVLHSKAIVLFQSYRAVYVNDDRFVWKQERFCFGALTWLFRSVFRLKTRTAHVTSK